MPRMILVGGGSSSGKSYLTSRVLQNIGPDSVTRITIDDYYKDQKDMTEEERVTVNYDHPKAFDWPLLRRQLNALKDGKPIRKPVYDFVARTRSDKVEEIVPKNLIVIEGIMALVDKNVRDLADLRVFIDAGAERRFLRRIIRDSKERGRSFESIVNQYFSTVQPMYDEIVKPSSMYADLIVNNDGVENLAVEVLTCVFLEQLSIANGERPREEAEDEEFNEAVLAEVFRPSKGH